MQVIVPVSTIFRSFPDLCHQLAVDISVERTTVHFSDLMVYGSLRKNPPNHILTHVSFSTSLSLSFKSFFYILPCMATLDISVRYLREMSTQ